MSTGKFPSEWKHFWCKFINNGRKKYTTDSIGCHINRFHYSDFYLKISIITPQIFIDGFYFSFRGTYVLCFTSFNKLPILSCNMEFYHCKTFHIMEKMSKTFRKLIQLLFSICGSFYSNA